MTQGSGKHVASGPANSLDNETPQPNTPKAISESQQSAAKNSGERQETGMPVFVSSRRFRRLLKYEVAEWKPYLSG
jgi:hypothetical protein